MSARRAVTTLGRALGGAVSARGAAPRAGVWAPALSSFGSEQGGGVGWDHRRRAVDPASCAHRAWSSFHATSRAEDAENDSGHRAGPATLGGRRVVPGASSFASPIAARHPTSRARSSAAGEVTEAADDDTPGGAVDARPDGVEYEAALAETVRMVKLLSLASLGATIAGTPLLLELSSPDLPANAKLTVSLVVDTFGAFTTGLLQWFVSPYVLKMRMADEHTVAVEKLTLFARRYEETFAVADMREAETTRPLVTWEADGKLHYVEMGRVPGYLYDRLGLERFDAQAMAEKHAKERKEEDEEDEY